MLHIIYKFNVVFMNFKNIIFVIGTFLFLTLNVNGQSKKLLKNTKAPNIIATDITGKKVNLTEFSGSKKVLITFHRYASCPICNFKIRELIKNYKDLSENGMEVVMFIESSKEKILQATKNLVIPFYIIPDPKSEYYKIYGVKRNSLSAVTGILNKNTRKMLRENWKNDGSRGKDDGYYNRMGADFVVDLNGNIEDLHYGKFLGDGLDIQMVKNMVVK